MKPITITISSIFIIAVCIITGCNTTGNKGNNKVNNAENLAYLAEVSKYADSANNKIAVNFTTYDNFENTLEEQNKDSKEMFQGKLKTVKDKNNAMQDKLDGYKETGKENWIAFKVDFNKGMDSIDKSFSDLTQLNNQPQINDNAQ